jgi:hypothetical protein
MIRHVGQPATGWAQEHGVMLLSPSEPRSAPDQPTGWRASGCGDALDLSSALDTLSELGAMTVDKLKS